MLPGSTPDYLFAPSLPHPGTDASAATATRAVGKGDRRTGAPSGPIKASEMAE